jgi:copper(I)-binding protein
MNADRTPMNADDGVEVFVHGDSRSMKHRRPSALHRRSSAIAKILACMIVGAATLDVAAAVTATDAWVRGTVPAQQSTGAFVTLKSTDPVKVIKVESPAARSVGIHATENHGGVMEMHAVDSLALPAGAAVELKPGGYHVMLEGLVRPLVAGDKVPLTFTIEDPRGKRSQVEVRAEVRPLGQ